MPGFNIPVEQCQRDYDLLNNAASYSGQSNIVETARNHRYILELMSVGSNTQSNSIFGGRNDGILLYAYKCTRPTPSFDEIEVHNGQDVIYRPGKIKWMPIDISFYERLYDASDNGPIDDKCARLLYNWWSSSMMDIDNSRFRELSSFMAHGILRMVDGSGNNVWTYHLMDCFPIKISPSDLSYLDSDISNITLTLRFQKAYEVER